MDLSQEIEKLVAARCAWRQRLNAVISDGSSDLSVENLKLDNRCEFGKWYYGLPAVQRDSEQGRKIQELPAAFHVGIARVFALALAVRKTVHAKAWLPAASFSHSAAS